MTLRPTLRRGLDLSSASAALAPTPEEVARFGRRSADVGRDRRPGRPLERPPQPSRLPKPRSVEPAPEPEPEPERELSPGEEQRIRDAASGRLNLRAVRSTHKALLGL
jgi:hypothetical protein